MGFHRAGFEVVGVDIKPQPHYPFEFHQEDALTLLERLLSFGTVDEFVGVHASPPCQFATAYKRRPGHVAESANLIPPTRELLEASGLPWVIENVEQARPWLRSPVTLCGSSFGLDVRQHRLFETNWPLMGIACAHGLQRSNPHRIRAPYVPPEDAIVPVYGGGQVGFPIDRQRAAMGIAWMNSDEIKEAIPPAYTEYIGHQLLAHIRQKVAA